MWTFRQLLFFLVWRDIKVRYKQMFFGIFWAILTPFSQAIIFSLIFGYFLKIPISNTPYLLLVFSGFTFWNFLSQSILTATYSLTTNSHLVSKAVFPKEVLVLASIISRIPDLIFSFIILIFMLFIYQIPLSPLLIWILPLTILEIILTFAVSLFLSSTNVYFRDISALIPLILTIWLYITPVMYTVDAFPDKYRPYTFLNPLTGIIIGIRNVMFSNKNPETLPLLFSIFLTLLIFVTSFYMFKKLEKGFADVI